MCQVCADPFTDVVRQQVTCPFCQFACCSRCIKTYLVSTTKEPNCMNCFREFTSDFLVSFVSKNWLQKDYSDHKKALLLEKEKAMLPETQDLVQNYKLCQEMKQTADKIAEDIAEKQALLADLKRGCHALESSGYKSNHVDAQRTARIFVRACPVDGCRGFLSTQYKCGTCDAHVCAKCFEPKQIDHTCDPEKLASAQLIAKDTKPCPKCAALTHKIDGCSQMWCTVCHTAWSWTTGRVETGTVHNPHYYQYLRETGHDVPRNPLDVPCGGMPGISTVLHRTMTLGVGKEDRSKLAAFHRMVVHVRRVKIVDLRDGDDNSDIRLDYLLNKIDEDAMKIKVYKRHCLKERVRAFNFIYQMYADVGEDVFRKLLDAKAEDIPSILRELETLTAYATNQLLDTSHRFGVTPRNLL